MALALQIKAVPTTGDNGRRQATATTAMATTWRGREKEGGKKPNTHAAAPLSWADYARTFADASKRQEREARKKEEEKESEEGGVRSVVCVRA